MLIFIPGSVPSSKNSRRNFGHVSLPSELTEKWRENTACFWNKFRSHFIKECQGKQFPLIVGIHFVRKSKHKWDFINPCQTVQDEMMHKEWIADDNTSIMYPVPLKIDNLLWSYDSKNPGVYIRVLNNISEASLSFSK
jgi:hypothetical protein